MKGCVKCKTEATCEQCNIDSFFLNPKTKKCEPCSVDCNRCSSKTDCSGCIKGFYLEKPKKITALETVYGNGLGIEGAHCQPCIGNCVECKMANECDICKPNFKYKNGSCIKKKMYETVEFYLFMAVFIFAAVAMTWIACKCNKCKKERMAKKLKEEQIKNSLAKGLISGGETEVRWD